MHLSEQLVALQAENNRLVALLDARGVAWRLDRVASPETAMAANAPTSAGAPAALPGREPQRLSTADKLALFARLFKGRTDVYPVRWESKASGKAGYAPACANEWRVGVCDKPRIKCSDCGNRLLIALSDAVIYRHLAGDQTVGVYALLPDDTCHFVAVDFDEARWRDDASGFALACADLGVPVALEISRSGKGAHAWIFFSAPVSARDARRLATALISHTCARTRQLTLASYDRLFPNQDTMPKGGFGNLIALPLQKHPRGSDAARCATGAAGHRQAGGRRL